MNTVFFLDIFSLEKEAHIETPRSVSFHTGFFIFRASKIQVTVSTKGFTCTVQSCSIKRVGRLTSVEFSG